MEAEGHIGPGHPFISSKLGFSTKFWAGAGVLKPRYKAIIAHAKATFLILKNREKRVSKQIKIWKILGKVVTLLLFKLFTQVRRYAGTQVRRYAGTQVRRYAGTQVREQEQNC
jgi:hypothetical protein